MKESVNKLGYQQQLLEFDVLDIVVELFFLILVIFYIFFEISSSYLSKLTILSFF